MTSTVRIRVALAAALMILLVALPGSAIQPAVWTHTTEADYEPGKKEDTVVTNLGDVKLAASTREVAKAPEETSIIYDIQELGGGVFLAVGPEGKLMGYRAGQLTEHHSFAGEQIFALDVFHGQLLIGVSGEKSRLDILTPEGVKPLAELPGVRYVWDMIVDGDRIYLATGTEGKLLMVDVHDRAAVKTTELLDAAQANLICLGRDGNGNLYAGSDTDGLVYRVHPRKNPKEGDAAAEVFVVYDATEPEIGALLVMPDGTVFAGTADADQARPGRLKEASTEQAGRPGEAGAEPVPQPPAGEPKPVEPPKAPGIPQVPPEPEPTQQNDQAPAEVQPQPSNSENAKPESGLPGHRPLPLSDQAPAPDAETTESADGQAPAPVTAEQRDRLRQVIREQLEKARKTGALQGPPRGGTPMARVRPPGAAGTQPGQVRPPAGPTSEGNAVYRINPQGFVSEVFRESVMILRLMKDPTDENRLLVATGNEGQIFRVDLSTEETTIIADLEPQQVPALAVVSGASLGAKDKRPTLLLGTANPALLVQMDEGFAKEGTYTSTVLDASQVSLWGKLHLIADMPRDTGVGVQTRSGNVQDPEQAAWSDWSEMQTLEHAAEHEPLAPFELSVTSPPARFLQYRLTLRGDTHSTSVVDRVDIAHVVPNLKPVIKSVKVTNPNAPAPAGGGTPGGPGAATPGPAVSMRPRPNLPGAPAAEEPQRQTTQTIEWEGSDPNNDKLTYTIEYRAAGSAKWLPLAKDLTEVTYEWQTLRVPDGRYVLRLTASDAPDNTPDMAKTASRDSDPIVIDNTPPELRDLKAKVDGKKAVVTGVAADKLSTIGRVQYALDQTDTWQPVLPDDLIYDSTREAFSATISSLVPGSHVLTLRATDAQNNAVYAALVIEVK